MFPSIPISKRFMDAINPAMPQWAWNVFVIIGLIALTALLIGFFLIFYQAWFPKKRFPKIDKCIKIMGIILFTAVPINAFFFFFVALFNIKGIFVGIIGIIATILFLIAFSYMSSKTFGKGHFKWENILFDIPAFAIVFFMLAMVVGIMLVLPSRP